MKCCRMNILGLILLMSVMIMVCLCRSAEGQLTADFYATTCPTLSRIVMREVFRAFIADIRIGASLLRLHFHDCFVNSGGPEWRVLLGRRDGLTSNPSGANNGLPGPFDPLDRIIAKFAAVGLDVTDVVTLSGGHTFGRARCFLFSNRLYNFSGSGSADPTLDSYLAFQLQTLCPQNGDGNMANLDQNSAFLFDNHYYNNLINNKGLLSSDQILFSGNAANTMSTKSIVQSYSVNTQLFFSQFASSMVKMGNISPLTGSAGQVRKNCRMINSN